MKYFVGFTLTLVLSALLIFCNKDHNVKLNSTSRLRCNYDVDLVCNNSIPHYSSQQVFDDIYLCLEEEYENHNDAFEQQYSHLTDNQLDDVVDSLQFNEEETLDNWEVTKGYTSLRTRLNSEEETWLLSGCRLTKIRLTMHYAT